MEEYIKYVSDLINEESPERTKKFIEYVYKKLSTEFEEHLMNIFTVKENEINQLQLYVPNASVNKLYEYTLNLDLPTDIKTVEVSGLCVEVHGLEIKQIEGTSSYIIKGTPKQAGTFNIIVRYKFESLLKNKEYIERNIQIIINPDPRDLWKNIPVDWGNMPEPKYMKEDTECEYILAPSLSDGTPQKDIVAASKRGRSHAQEGKPRDDHFKLKHMDNGWYIISVADGAGSAKFSREGSQIACNTVVDYCQSQLIDNKKFEENIECYNEFKNDSESEARKIVGDDIYKIVGTAAFKAQQAINKEANRQNLPAKMYATTLLLSICKKFSFGWFVASFWVGDGAICLFDKKSRTAKLLGIPDEGEYAGQTRFLTMPEIFKDATALYQRLRFNIVDDFTALFLMTDGVSDPMFETDANLNNYDKWETLWDRLANDKDNPVHLVDDNKESAIELLNWLDFWSPGNHDDRTIAILY